jgi:signal transduction histidine kinase
MGIQAMVRDVTEQKQLRESMQFYISQTIRAQEEERRRIVCELHDETAQSLAALLFGLNVIAKDKA